MTDCPNRDAEKAALAEALRREVKRRFHSQGCLHWKSCGEMRCTCGAIADWQQTDALLADLSPAAKEILEKAQAHDDMKAELERLRGDLAHLDACGDEFCKRCESITVALKEPE